MSRLIPTAYRHWRQARADRRMRAEVAAFWAAVREGAK